MLDDKTILITGGTGSFGKSFVKLVLEHYRPKKMIVFSRDELKQYEMEQKYPERKFPCMRYFLGDVRDKERLYRAFKGVDYVIHAAAQKQVPASEYNPFEAVKTNVIGAQNVIDAAIDNKVRRVIALSTDKAVNPINLYGATKLCSDKLFIAGNAYVKRKETRFSVVRYGNVIGSRGSVIPFFQKMKQKGILPITDSRMTRFWIDISSGVKFVIDSLKKMVGGEIFVPKIPSMNILDLAKAICPDCKTEIIGIRSGEKLHEVMISKDDALNTIEYDNYYVIKPNFRYFGRRFDSNNCKFVPEDFEYNSYDNPQYLTVNQLKSLIN